MSRKGKQILWHKKSGKILPGKFLKTHKMPDPLPLEKSGSEPEGGPGKKKAFAKKFLSEIKRAAKSD